MLCVLFIGWIGILFDFLLKIKNVFILNLQWTVEYGWASIIITYIFWVFSGPIIHRRQVGYFKPNLTTKLLTVIKVAKKREIHFSTVSSSVDQVPERGLELAPAAPRVLPALLHALRGGLRPRHWSRETILKTN